MLNNKNYTVEENKVWALSINFIRIGTSEIKPFGSVAEMHKKWNADTNHFIF